MKQHRFHRSSTLTWASYDDDAKTLDLGFVNGGRYRYFVVPLHVFDELTHAESAGRYFLQNIRNRYPYREIT
jgi:hypothetical protein